ncbi:uncharacterized protein LOC130780489 [Actinidia eriantha]|uniref:uncharacterized protein LOC130780489 n=1 Tax=Actinidia eriantha TaxID=165200 RepID=UPI00258C7229|nr:uncharacterized protein LOC130780489 [Actinidia eriantha]
MGGKRRGGDNLHRSRMIRNPALAQHVWAQEDIHQTFFKCTRWQLEETMDPVNCPYHYFCDSTYPDPGNYPPAVDVLVFCLTTASYLAALISILMEMYGTTGRTCRLIRRYLLPSGPVSLPIILLALAKGHKINTLFPISCIGPSMLQLIQISALALDINTAEKNIKYAFYNASTISAILHASLYLDSTILPYYTGFDALVSSTFSGECISCVCRREVLVVGGKLISYRGWSLTTFLVVGTLCLRIICRLSTENKGKTILIKATLENSGWIFIATDCVYLIANSPPERSLSRAAASSGLFVLICLHVLRKACTCLMQWHSRCKK